MEAHTHGPNGEIILVDDAPAEAAEAVAEVADAQVEVAKIEAKRDVDLARESTKAAEVYANEELAALRGRVQAMEAILETLAPPEPEPVPEAAPVIVEAPPAPVETEPEAPAPEPAEQKVPAKKKNRSWFG
ncbi:hypothetical protein [Actinomadura violacea]|uniref:Uncharacterized protein n=1 Tax=Actinomadura violacea TaxID=2819934 RepID=A0ABS3RWC3_9ACTN|nr:hypothetical protein [Actinomadura violacea]MBO2460982.1 hypothetical protein [Actinomadura violacea]